MWDPNLAVLGQDPQLMLFFYRVLIGAPFSLQSGMSSSMQIGSITAPDRICAPVSDSFSMSETMPSFGRELFQADGGIKTRGAATDDNDVMFDAFPLLS